MLCMCIDSWAEASKCRGLSLYSRPTTLEVYLVPY